MEVGWGDGGGVVGVGLGGAQTAGGETEGETAGDGENNGDEHDEEDGVDDAGGGFGCGWHGGLRFIGLSARRRRSL